MNDTIITNNVFKKNITKKLEWDVNVPDSKKDVLKILSSQTECTMTEYSFSQNVFTAHIEAMANILYIPDDPQDSTVCKLETKESFTVKGDIPADMLWELEDIEIKSIYEPCVLLNSRKLGIRTDAVIEIVLYKNTPIDALDASDEIKCDTKAINATCIHAVANEKINISPTFTLPSGKPGIKEVLRCNVNLGNKELKPITNKAVLKGNLIVHLFYISDISTLESAEFVTPFTEIADVSGIDDNMELMYSACVKKTEIRTIPGEENSAKGIDINGVIDLKVKAYTTSEAAYICDAYSPEYTESISSCNANYVCISKTLCDTYNFKEVFEFGDCEISEVYDVSASVVTQSASIENNKIIINSVMMCDVIYKTQNGIRCDKKSVNFEFVQDIYEKDCFENISMMNETENLSYVIAGHNLMEIRCNVVYTTHLFSQKDFTYINNVSIDKQKRKTINRAPVVAYFPKQDEKIFDIAKKYCSTPENIRQMNSLSGAYCKKGSCVIIE